MPFAGYAVQDRVGSLGSRPQLDDPTTVGEPVGHVHDDRLAVPGGIQLTGHRSGRVDHEDIAGVEESIKVPEGGVPDALGCGNQQPHAVPRLPAGLRWSVGRQVHRGAEHSRWAQGRWVHGGGGEGWWVG